MEDCVSHIPCALCQARNVKVISEVDRHGNKLRNVICKACGLVWVDPRPDSKDTRLFYKNDYRKKYKGKLQPKMKHVYREVRRAIDRVKQIHKIYKPGMKILDIGAGAGFFSYVAKKIDMNILGIEPNVAYSNYAREILKTNVKTGFLTELDQYGDDFDIVTINHVFEHLDEPEKSIQIICDILKPEGYLVMEVPNIEATYHSPNNIFHVGHLYWFNPTTIVELGKKAGLAVHELTVLPQTSHINIVFKNTRSSIAVDPLAYQDNYQRIMRIRQSHHPVKHYLSRKPYTRFFSKLLGSIKEMRAVAGYRSGLTLAEATVNKHCDLVTQD